MMSSNAEVRDTVIKQREDDDQPREYMVVRRKKRTRARQQLQTEAPVQKFRLILLAVVVLLIIMVLTGSELKRLGKNVVQQASGMIPPAVVHTFARPEVILLILAALILVYLMVPSLEPKLMSMLGIQRRRRRH